MELVYLWVEKYKNIEQQGFNFSGRYRCEYNKDKNELTIIENKEYIHIFPENINVTAIVGKNGSGKSSISEVILRTISPSITVKRINGKFQIRGPKDIKITTSQEINSNNDSFQSIYMHSDVIKPYEIVDWETYSNYGEHLANPYNRLLKHDSEFWHLDLGKFQRNFYQLIFENIDNFKSDIFTFLPSKALLKTRKTSHLKHKLRLDINNTDNDTDEFVFKLGRVEAIVNNIISNSNQSNKPSEHFLTFLLKEYLLNISTIEQLNALGLYEEADYIDASKMTLGDDGFYESAEESYNITDFLDEIIKFSYSEDKNLYSSEDNSYEKKRNKFNRYMNFFNQNTSAFEASIDIETIKSLVNSNKEIFYSLIGMQAISIDFEDTIGRSFFKLSHGERKFFSDSLLVYNEINCSNKNDILILLDEPDLTLHPEWQKKYLNHFFTLCKNIRTKQFHIIIASHSPFILSDLPKENVIFLEDGKQIDVNIDTFGANIHTLLSHGFFMKDGLMGEFAKEKIDTVIIYLNQKELTNNEIDYCESIISIIGEPILKKQLQRMLDSKKIHYLAKDTKEEIEFLKHRIDLLSKRL